MARKQFCDSGAVTTYSRPTYLLTYLFSYLLIYWHNDFSLMQNRTTPCFSATAMRASLPT